MDGKSLEFVNTMKNNQAYHQACKNRFNRMLFQLFGNKSLVEIFVRFPICSALEEARIFAQTLFALKIVARRPVKWFTPVKTFLQECTTSIIHILTHPSIADCS